MAKHGNGTGTCISSESKEGRKHLRKRNRYMKPANQLSIIEFVSAQKWQMWLSKNYAASNGIWLKLFKKDSGRKTVTYAEALDVALCFGWIDGVKQAHDQQSWLQKFCPRGAKSIWSKKNIEHIERLIKEGKMKTAGLKVVEEAKKNGRWEKAYDAQSKMTIPDDFLKELSKNKKAVAFFGTLNRANLFSIAFRLQTAKKTETREKRMKLILAMLANEEKFH